MKKDEFKVGQIIVNNKAFNKSERGQLILVTGVENWLIFGLFQKLTTKQISFVIDSVFAEDCELVGYTDSYQYIDSNSTKFKPVWPSECYLEQLLSTKSNQNMSNEQNERKLIGYKLSGKASAIEVARLLNCSENIYEHDLFFNTQHLDNVLLEKAKDLGILDIWFIPVFEDEINVKFKEGDFIHISYTGQRFQTHFEFGQIMNLDENEFLTQYKVAPETNVIEFIKYSKFSNCDNVIIGKMNGFYYAFGNDTEQKRKYYRIATPDEVTKAKLRKFIGTYEVIKKESGSIDIGCQTFSRAEINAYKRITKLIIDNNITLSPEEIIKLVTI